MEKVEHDYRESINGSFTWKRLFMELSLIGELSFLFTIYKICIYRFHCVCCTRDYSNHRTVFQSFLYVC